MNFLDLQIVLGFRQEKHILPLSICSHLSEGLRAKNSAHLLTSCLWSAKGQGNFNPAGGFQGLGFDQAMTYTAGSVSLPEPSSSCCCTLYVDFTAFFTAVTCTSLGLGSDLEYSFVFHSITQTFLKQLNVSAPTGFLKSNPETVISLTQRSYSAVGRRLIRLLSMLRDSKQAYNSAPLI